MKSKPSEEIESKAHEALEKAAVKKSFPSKFRKFAKEESKEREVKKSYSKKVSR